MKKYCIYIGILSVILSSFSCSKSGSTVLAPVPEDTTVIVVDPDVVISFTPTGSPSDNTVYLEEVSKDDNLITLAIKVKGGINVFGSAIELTYVESLLEYVSAVEGTYLNQSGTETMFIPSNLAGTLIIGYNRRGTIQGANGDGLLATIVFRAKAKQTNTSISFNAANCDLKLPAGSSPVNIAGTSWLGGNINYK